MKVLFDPFFTSFVGVMRSNNSSLYVQANAAASVQMS